MTDLESTGLERENPLHLVHAFITALLICGWFTTNAQFCDQAQGGAGFPSDITCQNAVCAQDPFCCNTTWDALCATIAASLPQCAGCLSTAGGGGSGYNMPGGTITTCSGNFYDTGGPSLDYGNSQNIATTFCSAVPGQCITLSFSAFNIEPNFDLLYIYDGASTAAPIIGIYTGVNSPGVVTSTSGCLTVRFTSDLSVAAPGWAASISCGTCSPSGCAENELVFSMFDSFGDGWNGAVYSISNSQSGAVVASGTLANGLSGSNVLCLPDGCYQLSITAGSWPSEIGWSLSGTDQGTLSALAPNAAPFSIDFSLNTSWSDCSSSGGLCAPGVGGSVFAGSGSIQIQQNLSPEALIADVFLGGDCLTASNISFTGNPASIGTFSNGWGIGIESGIILTTGNANDALGPNIANGTSFASGGGPSPLLSGNTFDQSTFTFTFVPETNQVTFTYVFASEEYPDYVCSQFNDAFGFFVSGPGYAPNTNIAIIPGSTLPVAINSVNSGFSGIFGTAAGCTSLAYSAYFNNNVGGTHNEYDGFTVPLTACITTVPCEPYTITITVADVGDASFDSAVFLEAESFTAGVDIQIGATATQAGVQSSSDTCEEDGFFVFALDQPFAEDVTLVFDIDVDGQGSIDNPPTSVFIPAGQLFAQVDISALEGSLGTGLTTVTVTMDSQSQMIDVGCTCEDEFVTSTLYFCNPTIFLPVEWLSFEAETIHQEREVLCSWQTASELNNEGFTVERSANGENWADIGFVDGAGNTSVTQSYNYIDRQPLPGRSYYRLRQTDFNGAMRYSEIRSVVRKSSGTLAVYPNPGNDVFRISGHHDGELNIYDLNGRMVPFTLNETGELRLHDVSAGCYIVEIQSDDVALIQRVRLVVQ